MNSGEAVELCRPAVGVFTRLRVDIGKGVIVGWEEQEASSVARIKAGMNLWILGALFLACFLYGENFIRAIKELLSSDKLINVKTCQAIDKTNSIDCSPLYIH